MDALVKWIVEQPEQKRHFKYFEERERLWSVFKADDVKWLSVLIAELKPLYTGLTKKYSRVQDGYSLLQLAWTQPLGCFLTEQCYKTKRGTCYFMSRVETGKCPQFGDSQGMNQIKCL